VEIGEFLMVMRMVEIDREFLFDELLDVHEELVFFGRAIRNCVTGGSGASGAADAVDVGFGLVGNVHVDDESDILDIDSTGRDIGGDEDGEGALFELLEGALALGLGAVAVDRLGIKSVGDDGFAELVGSVFGAGEDDGESVVVLITKVLEKEVLFGILVDEADPLLDFFGGGLLGLDGNVGRIVQDGVGEVLDGGSKGGREEEGLLLARKSGDDLFDVAKEAHVKHTVDLIEDEVFHAGEIDVSLVHVIEKATGAGHEDIDTGSHRADLRVFSDAAEDEGFGKADVLAVGLEALRNLGGEFAGGGENEDTGGAAHGPLGVVVEGVEDGQRERCGFTGAGLRDSEEVLSFEKKGDGLGLDGRWRGVILLGKSTFEGSCEGKLLE
jgi:hypothetical protein